MKIFFSIFLLTMLILNYKQSYADYVDWECTKHVKVVEKKEFIIFSDITEAKLQAEKLKGELVGIKDVEGNLAYLVFYKVAVVESNLVEGNDCKQFN